MTAASRARALADSIRATKAEDDAPRRPLPEWLRRLNEQRMAPSVALLSEGVWSGPLPAETWCATCGLATAGTNYCATCDAALAAYVPAVAIEVEPRMPENVMALVGPTDAVVIELPHLAPEVLHDQLADERSVTPEGMPA